MSDEEVQILPEKALAKVALFKPDSWLTTIDFITNLVLENNILTAILGEQGNGKTSFTHILQAELAPQINAHIIKAGPLFNRSFFLQQLNDLLGMEGEPLFSNFIARSQQEKSHGLLIIDDAQFLSAVFIEELLGELQLQGKSAYFHVCLVSDFSLVPVLNKLAQNIYKDMVHSIELGALSENETKSYLLQYLTPRQNVEKKVTDLRVKQFYQLTAGHLVDINRHMTSYFSAKQASKKPMLFRPAFVASVFLVFSGTYMWYSHLARTVPQEFMDQTVKVAEIDENVAIPSQIVPALISVIPTYEVGALRQDIVATPIRRADLIAMNEEDKTASDATPMVIVDKVIVAPKVMPKGTEKKPQEAVLKSGKKNQKTAHSNIEPSRYTIQLLASHSKKELQRFVQNHQLKGKAKLRCSLRDGVAWYVLTLGEYSRRLHAQEAAKKLPKTIIDLKPWVRKTADLKTVG